MGLNTGAAEAHNLAWKLAAVEHGWGGRALLDSYEAERRPIAHANAQQSLRNAMQLFEVLVALGVDADPAVSRANFADVLSTPEGRERVRVATEHQAEHFDMLGLQLGFSYPADVGLVVDDGSPLEVPADVVRDYVPTTRPGARLPHAWVERDGQRVSTLDLVPLDRFVLLTASAAWAAAGDRLAAGAVAGRQVTPLDVVLVGRDIHDVDGSWAAVCGVPAAGALLVRPDQHVGWRAFDAAGNDAAGNDAVGNDAMADGVLRAALALMTCAPDGASE
jgi:2,4-dichlorophenol 6-monooxygenase